MRTSVFKLVAILTMILLPSLSQAQVRCWDPTHARSEWIKWDDKQPLRVLVFLSPDCPLCRNYTLTLNQLQKEYGGSVSFLGIIPGKAYADSEVMTFIQKYKIAFPIYIDSARSMSTLLQAEVTPEAYLLRTAKKIVYHGSIDNWAKDLGMQSARPTKFYLQNAIARTLAGLPVEVTYNKPVGCLINDY